MHADCIHFLFHDEDDNLIIIRYPKPPRFPPQAQGIGKRGTRVRAQMPERKMFARKLKGVPTLIRKAIKSRIADEPFELIHEPKRPFGFIVERLR
jgi:hypothetical protein